MTSRKQGVLLNGQCSSWIDIRAGLPQGFIVGDLLFLKALRQLLWRKLLWWKNHLDWQTCLISMFSKFFIPYEHVWQHYLESILEFQNRFMLKFRNLQNQQTYTRRILEFHYIIYCVSIVDEPEFQKILFAAFPVNRQDVFTIAQDKLSICLQKPLQSWHIQRIQGKEEFLPIASQLIPPLILS